MAALTITREIYHDKVYGGWLGKNAGGTLGSPIEGRKEPASLSFYDPTPGQAAWNEDLDFQLVWLHVLRERGPDLTSDDLTEAWLDHIAYPWDEYGYAVYNVRRGLHPPITGSFNNWFQRSDGGAIRTEIWAMVAPGAPQVAASYAYRDSIIDHAEEGVWAAMFRAAVQSAAFVLSDPQSLLDVGLAMIPTSSRTARAVRIVRDAFRDQASPLEARGRVLSAVGSDNYTDAPQNIGFTTLGLLYGGGDFGASLCAAANCGYDADGNAGALGATLGIARGKSGLPENWLQPIGDSVVLGWGVLDLNVERTVAELTDHTVEAGAQVIATRCPDAVTLLDAEALPVAPVASAASPSPAVPGSPSATGSGFAMPDLSPAEPPAAVEPVTPVETAASPGAGFSVPTSPSSTTDATQVSPATEMPAPESTPAAEQGSDPVVDLAHQVAEQAPVPPPSHRLVDDASRHSSLVPEAPETVNAVLLRDNTLVKPLLVVPPGSAVYRAGSFEFVVDYGESGPALVPNTAASFTVAIRNLGEDPFMGYVSLSAPTGWQVAVPGAQGQRQMLVSGGMARYGFVLRVPDTVPLQDHNTVTLVLTPERGSPTTCNIGFLAGACWWFVGPFKNLADEGFDRAYPVEDRADFDEDYAGRAGGLIRWQKLAFRENVMSLESLFGGIAGVAYGVTTVHVAMPTDARIVVHTNDGVKVWLNRQRVLQRHSHESFRPTLGYGPASADVSLQAGDNQILVKVVRCGDPIEFAFALTDRDGKPLMGVGNTRW